MAYFNNLIVGGTAKFLQDIKVAGVETTKEELNYLHTYEVEKEGFPLNSCYYITENYTEGFAHTALGVNVEGSIGLQVGKTYTLTLTNYNDEIITYTAVATDYSSILGVSGAIVLPFDDECEVFDKVHFDILNIDTENEVFLPTSGGYMYTYNLELNFKEAILTGDGLKHTETVSGAAINKIYPPVEQYCYLNKDIYDETKNPIYTFTSPQGYNRCEIDIIISCYNATSIPSISPERVYLYPTCSAFHMGTDGQQDILAGTSMIGSKSAVWIGAGDDKLIGEGWMQEFVHITMLKTSIGVEFTQTSNLLVSNGVVSNEDEGCPENVTFKRILVSNSAGDVPLIWSPSSPYGFSVLIPAFTYKNGYKQCKITWYKE